MRDAGADIVSFTAGELDINSPESAKMAAIRAINENFTRYTISDGTSELRRAVAEYLQKQTDQKFNENQILMTNGCKQASYNLLMAIAADSDEVLLPAPYYPSHIRQLEMLGCTPVTVQTHLEDNYQLSREALDQALTSRTKALLITSPHNPTGAVYTLNTLKDIAEFVIENDLWLLSDEIYCGIVFPPARFESILKRFPRLRNRLLIANGLSKSFAMTGWRIGFAAAPEEIIRIASNVQANTTSNVCSISQKAALAALQEEPDYAGNFIGNLMSKRDYALNYLNSIDGVLCNQPGGAFYLFPNIQHFLGSKFQSEVLDDSKAVAHYLLTEHKVAVVPGEEFGAEGHFRISFAADQKVLEKGLARIKKGLEQLK